ncbi:ATPase family associated with various cellular activities (AAA) domain-containing protein [Ditylenchus destructor]|uniref:ATPase family associated with various cellular activities (AAA) domain-containing protein n=1 Tax=Ditylenchus destructor TaxID=166010 RepID=A0AAD4ND32_9BILA|nr:ATPase family associated with various cellular activities (AAA) domain-containing protein [Ditylenchus destructor]
MEIGVEANGLNRQICETDNMSASDASVHTTANKGMHGNGVLQPVSIVHVQPADEDQESNCGESNLIHIEVRLRSTRNLNAFSTPDKCNVFKEYIKTVENIYNWRPLNIEDEVLALTADRIVVCSAKYSDGQRLVLENDDIRLAKVHIYAVKDFGPMPQDLKIDESDDTTSSSSIGSHHHEMPCKEFEDLWEVLVYDDDIKSELLSYAYALLQLSDRGANSNVLAINRLILLHGPPGTGKTTVCKALAQRLSIRLSNRYKRSIFVEVNSHSLFSKWFSESGKLIGKLFEEIQELASHTNYLVCVLIDEVESLTMGRNAAFSGADPSDSVRAVNAVLTQLDKIKRFPNVLVLATSNISTALDSAFVDRTDICRMVGNPSSKAACVILASAIAEFQRIKVITEWPKLFLNNVENEKCIEEVECLKRLAGECAGLSGRAIRKLPILAYSKCSEDKPCVKQLLHSLEKAIKDVAISHTVKQT